VADCDSGRVNLKDLLRRRVILLPVVLATTFLVIIGAFLGSVLGSRAAARKASDASHAQGASTGVTASPSAAPYAAPTPMPPSAAPPTRTDPPPRQAVTAPVGLVMPAQTDDYRAGASCPKPMAALAKKIKDSGQFNLVLYLYTSDDLSVWVCEDLDGALYYLQQQRGQNGRRIASPVVFLADVTKVGLEFQARDTGAAKVTTYHASPMGLIVEDDHGRHEDHAPRPD
jgi:hypothetical protein